MNLTVIILLAIWIIGIPITYFTWASKLNNDTINKISISVFWFCALGLYIINCITVLIKKLL